MTLPRRRALVLVVVLLGLLGAAHAQRGLARVEVLWRQSTLSWDDPASQLLDELASQPVPHADPARHARDRIVADGGAGGSLRVAGAPSGLPDSALRPCSGRAPPVA